MRFLVILGVVFVIALAAITPANAAQVTGFTAPWEKEPDVTVAGRVDGDPNFCGGISCKWHVSLQRSSWMGYQTVEGSRRDYYFGEFDANCLEGIYDYHSHYHHETLVQRYQEVHVAGTGVGSSSYEWVTDNPSGPSTTITCTALSYAPGPGGQIIVGPII